MSRHDPSRFTRRRWLELTGHAGLALTCQQLFGARVTRAAVPARAKRIIFVYFPDGVPGRSDAGEASAWHATGSETAFQLPPVLQPLEAFRNHCVFFNGLSMGGTDAGSHPGGAKKLLTGVDGGGGESLDQSLARTVGAEMPHRQLYLGVQATISNASGDKFISYTGPGQTVAPTDDPAVAFSRVIDPSMPGGTTGPTSPAATANVLDRVRGHLTSLQARLGTTEASKLEQHLTSLQEVRARVMTTAVACGGAAPAQTPSEELFRAERFPTLLRQQMDVMVAAMACARTRVGVLQCSHHTSELSMSRFSSTEMYRDNYDMRSHQASHYGPAHDESHTEYWHYLRQRRWFVEQFAYLLGQLQARPEDGGTMLDHSLVLLCTEVSDGNTHSHDQMPFILGGGGGGAIRTGRLLQFDYQRHSNLLVALAHAMGANFDCFGQECSGPLPGLLTT